MHNGLSKVISEAKVDSLLINVWCFINIKLISFVGVRILNADENSVVVRLKLNRRTKNHLNSMYMGAQVIGAEIGPVFYAIKYCELNSLPVNSEYKDVSADFKRKTKGKYVYFKCEDTRKIKETLDVCASSTERAYEKIKVGAYDDKKMTEKSLVSEFEFTATFRQRRSRH